MLNVTGLQVGWLILVGCLVKSTNKYIRDSASDGITKKFFK